jgi:hypothetical protein
MPKFARSLLIAALMFVGSAQAFVANVGTNPASVSFSNGFGAGGTFADAVAFDLTGPYVVSTFAFSQWTTPTSGLRSMTIDLFRGATLLGTVGPSAVVPGAGAVPSFTALSFSDLLGPGSYRAVLGGDIRPDGGSYVWGLTATLVPEPGTWALLAGGLALLGVMARRRAMS